ncbi:hypothetical protein Q8W71_00325 [Methylobacterium sp. NEAU 140]|uniref:hypothetical protein n=1 Tax=Methylobacterium sp. NEAU 140 TaxID=3064945 RepID=UPI002736BC21|nr:hypothetical protein [Methylobacterium sp. NEAU 140]MDP4021054.1 hypothetical protein [Methylobacterium sp. NEAU 140]
MPNVATLAACGIAALLTGPALAQAVIVAPDDFSPDDEVVVREYVVRRPVLAPDPIVGSIPLRPGSIVPADVALAPFTDAPNPSLRRYGYFVAPGNKVVVVDPATRAVVRILDR